MSIILGCISPLRLGVDVAILPNRIFDLSAERCPPTEGRSLRHPAGISLPFDCPGDAELVVPELRAEIRSGAYCADLVRLLPQAVRPGDRVLVVGAGLGVVSTLVARTPAIERVIAVEADTRLVPYLSRLHAQNGVPEVEIVNAVLADGQRGRAPFFARRDPRDSSLLPDDSEDWQKVIMVPYMDLGLVLTEERISLVICDIPRDVARALGASRLDTVERLLVDCSGDPAPWWQEGEICAELSRRGYLCGIHSRGQRDTALLFTKASRSGAGG